MRLYAPTFAFLPFTARAALQALNRPALSLILLDEVFDRTEEELRRAADLQAAFATYDELSTNGVGQFPALQRLQVRLVLKLLFILSLDGRGASARDLCAALLFHDEAAPQAAIQRIAATLERLAALAPIGGLTARVHQGEPHYRFATGEGGEFEAALDAAVARLPTDEAALHTLLRTFARARFNDWPASANDTDTTTFDLHIDWRGASRRGRLIEQRTIATISTVAPAAPDAQPEAAHYEWELLTLAPHVPGATQAAPADDARAKSDLHTRRPVTLLWQPGALTDGDALTLRRLLALHTDPALGEFVEATLAAHTTLATQGERIWTRLYLDDGAITLAGARLSLGARMKSVPTLGALLAQLLDAPFAARYPQHPQFPAILNESDCAHLVECMLGVVPEQDAQTQIEQFALPLGLAVKRDDAYTLECNTTVLAQPWCQAVLAHVEQSGMGGVSTAELQAALGSAPFGLVPAAQRLVVAALVAQRRLELVTSAGARVGRGVHIEEFDWTDVTGVARATASQHDTEELTAWARLLLGDDKLPSVADAAGRAAARTALAAWLEDWRTHALVARCEQLPDGGLTLRAWRLLKTVRRTFSIAAEAAAATLADAISLEEGLQRVADAFGHSVQQFAASVGERDALAAYVEGVAERERVRAYLAGAEPTGRAEIECARRELLLWADDTHSLFDADACARFELLWQEFHTRYVEHYAALHERAVGAECDRQALDETLRGDAWREFEALAHLPFVTSQHRREADALVAALRQARCVLNVRALLAEQPVCACSFRLMRAADLIAASTRLAEIVARGRAAARRTLALFHQHLARSLSLLAREKSSAAAARAGYLAEAFARGENPALLARADVRLVARAFELSPPPEPLPVPPPDLNHGSVTRAELHTRLADWLGDLPRSPALVEIAAKMARDGA